jgi:hypothetical protein
MSKSSMLPGIGTSERLRDILHSKLRPKLFWIVQPHILSFHRILSIKVEDQEEVKKVS